MSHGYLRAAGTALAIALASCSPQATDQAQTGSGSTDAASTATTDLAPYAQAMIDTTRAGIAFEAVSNPRFRVVRHSETGFACWFLPDSDAVVTVVEVQDLSMIGDDSVCIERSGAAEMAYRIARMPGVTLEEAFAQAKGNAGGWLSGPISEVPGIDSFAESPIPPNVPLDIPRLETVQVGEADGGPAMLRTSVARRPGDWYITQQYFQYLPESGVTVEQMADMMFQGSVIAEAVFAERLGEMIAPDADAAAGQP